MCTNLMTMLHTLACDRAPEPEENRVHMQGGRDKLGWVRQLVKYTETHPIYIADSASSAVEVLQNGSIQKTVFPSLKPNRREDALLLQQWLADMMAQLTANAPSSPADQASPSATCNTSCLKNLQSSSFVAKLISTWKGP